MSRTLPYPPEGGAQMRDLAILKILASEFDIDLVAADNSKPGRGELQELCEEIKTFNRGWKKQWDRVGEILRTGSLFLSVPAASSECRATVKQLLLQRQYSAIHVSLLYVASLLPQRIATPIVYDAHNVESLFLENRAEIEPHPLAKLILQREARHVRRFETELLQSSSTILTPSEFDRDQLLKLAPSIDGRVHLLPNGVDNENYKGVSERPWISGRITITGSTSWRPNYLGVKWFVQKVLPLLRRKLNDRPWSIQVVGNMNSSVVEELRRYPEVSTVSNPPDMRNFLAEANVIAVPVLASSGTRLRILEAWSCGRPVVSTTAGIQGLPGEDGAELLIADSAEEFAEAIAKLVRDETAARQIAKKAKEIAQRYDWSLYKAKLLEIYSSL